MSLSSHEEHALHSIEDRLCVSDPELASLLATFTRLTADEDMPAREKTPAGPQATRHDRHQRLDLGGREPRPAVDDLTRMRAEEAVERRHVPRAARAAVDAGAVRDPRGTEASGHGRAPYLGPGNVTPTPAPSLPAQ